jgi:hypothetical protein
MEITHSNYRHCPARPGNQFSFLPQTKWAARMKRAMTVWKIQIKPPSRWRATLSGG